NGTLIQAGGFVAFDQNQLGFSLSAAGETIYFKNPDQSRVLDALRFEGQENRVSFGRFPDGAEEFYRLAARTPGAPNSGILVHDIVINEIMYAPISGEVGDQYIELYNKGTLPVDLSGWKFTAGVNFTFPGNTKLAPDSYLVVANDAARLMSNYPNLNPANTLGNFGGKLSPAG